jgi:hypothetical protein
MSQSVYISAMDAYLEFLFPHAALRKYVFNMLKEGQFQIWYGPGNSGKSSFAHLILDKISHTRYTWIHDFDDLKSVDLSSIKGTHIFFVSDLPAKSRIDVNLLAPFLANKHMIILETNVLPTLYNTSDDLWEHVHPIPFVQTQVDKYPKPWHETFALPWGNYLEALLGENLGYTLEPPNSVKDLLLTLQTMAVPSAPCSTAGSVVSDPHIEESSPSPPAVYAPIHIILQYKGRPDDVLIIRADPTCDMFAVTFKQRYMGSKTTQHMPPNKLNTYLSIFFDALTYDKEPYDRVQFVTPFFPCILVEGPTAAFEYVTRQLLPQIHYHLDDWPSETTKGKFKLAKK